MYELNVKEIKAYFRSIHSKSEAVEYFSKFSGKYYAFDYETASKDPRKLSDALRYDRAYLMGASFCFDYNEAVYVPIQHPEENAEPEAIKVMTDFMRAYPCAAFNMPFEYGFTLYHFGFVPDVYTDMAVLMKVFDSNLPNSLKQLIFALYKYHMQTFVEVTNNRKDFRMVSVKNGFFYGGSDSLWTFRAIEDYEPKIRADAGLNNILNLENRLTPIICDLVYNSVCVDRDLLQSYRPVVEGNIKKIEQFIVERIADKCPDLVTPGIIQGLFTLNMNIDSPKDVKAFFHRLGYPVEGTGKEILRALKDPVADAFVALREEKKLLNTYITAYEDFIGEGDILRFGIRQIGAPTGRLAGSKPNLMAVPKIRD